MNIDIDKVNKCISKISNIIIQNLDAIIYGYTKEIEKTDGMKQLNDFYKKNNYLGYYDFVQIENINLFKEENVINYMNSIKNNYLKIYSKGRKNAI